MMYWYNIGSFFYTSEVIVNSLVCYASLGYSASEYDNVADCHGSLANKCPPTQAFYVTKVNANIGITLLKMKIMTTCEDGDFFSNI